MPADSTFFNRVLPIVLIALAAVMILLILVVVAVLAGILPS
jgi:hypothetical protein